MRTLSIQEATALCQWAINYHLINWGIWGNYPISGCSFLQFEDNPLVVKFDETTEFNGEKFKRIGWSRRIPGKESSVTFSSIISELKKSGVNFGTYPEKKITKEIEGKLFSLLIRQNPVADYPLPDVCILDESGNIKRSGITSNSKFYPFGEL
jgi:hypothetical protein